MWMVEWLVAPPCRPRWGTLVSRKLLQVIPEMRLWKLELARPTGRRLRVDYVRPRGSLHHRPRGRSPRCWLARLAGGTLLPAKFVMQFLTAILELRPWMVEHGRLKGRSLTVD